MRVASRFAIGVHILSLLEVSADVENTSEWMAGSVGVNPVIVRNVTGMLRRAGLVVTKRGVAGARLTKPLTNITLLDVFRAVEAVDEGELFAIHSCPSPDCQVGANIQATLEDVFADAQRAMETRLAQTTLADIVDTLRQQAAKAGASALAAGAPNRQAV